MYDGIKKAFGPTHHKIAPLKSALGETITDRSKQLNRWVEHYSVLYASDNTVSDAALCHVERQPVMEKLDMEPTTEELSKAIDSLTCGKAPGSDGITAEVHKCGKPALLDKLHKLLCQCWREGAVPHDMRDSTIITLYKNKGDRSDCNNYRGISLLSTTGELFARVVLNRLQVLAEKIYSESQAGFRVGRSTTDMIFSLRQLQEKCREQRKPLYMAFIDLTKAFDLVSRSGLFQLLERIGCPPQLLRILQSFHTDMHGTIQFDGSTSDPFKICCGVKQGCVLAPTLFGIFFSLLLRQAFGTCCLPTMQQWLAHSQEHLQTLMDHFSQACQDFSLVISLNKTKTMGQGTENPPSITINNYTLEAVNTFTYLGSTITDNLSLDVELSRCIGKDASTFRKLTERAYTGRYLERHGHPHGNLRESTASKHTERTPSVTLYVCKQDLKSFNISLDNWQVTAQDCLKWQKALRTGLLNYENTLAKHHETKTKQRESNNRSPPHHFHPRVWPTLATSAAMSAAHAFAFSATEDAVLKPKSQAHETAMPMSHWCGAEFKLWSSAPSAGPQVGAPDMIPGKVLE
ncbi:R2 Retrovirus-related Pol polyprotein from type I retrotransposable element [Takifugu flavidus]|uniref:R2 Retrovirus-related Pol polyprotein from type I retrotransposable element n=1 Tax=Takifugu flavidus TaxID=433684 RepID=A0A5C6MW44_9TELE|nr:R2 Retrovirus-related Pol polyprotein from type I retrotransposable element [Takifugu flavidus]